MPKKWLRRGRCIVTHMAHSTPSRPVLRLLPVVLTATAFAFAAVLAAFFPLSFVALYLAILPLPLVLLWSGRDVEAPLERIAASDAARAKARERASRAESARETRETRESGGASGGTTHATAAWGRTA